MYWLKGQGVEKIGVAGISQAAMMAGGVGAYTPFPIAVAANAFRVSATGILSEYNPDLAKGFFHTLEGGVSFGFAFALMILFHLTVKKIIDRRAPAAVAV